MLKYFRFAIGTFAGVFTYVFGEWSPVLTMLVTVVIIDYVTGIAAAAVKKELSSKKGFVGILKKFVIFAIVALSAAFDRLLPATHDAVKAMVCTFYIANESLSVIENAGEIGLPLPKGLIAVVEKLKGEAEN